MIYIPVYKETIACQWPGHDEAERYDLESHPVKKTQGATGYAGKLGYIEQRGRNPLIVRPKDYVVIGDDGIASTMTPAEFEARFAPKEIELEEKLETDETVSNNKSTGNKAKPKDNASRDSI